MWMVFVLKFIYMFFLVLSFSFSIEEWVMNVESFILLVFSFMWMSGLSFLRLMILVWKVFFIEFFRGLLDSMMFFGFILILIFLEVLMGSFIMRLFVWRILFFVSFLMMFLKLRNFVVFLFVGCENIFLIGLI